MLAGSHLLFHALGLHWQPKETKMLKLHWWWSHTLCLTVIAAVASPQTSPWDKHLWNFTSHLFIIWHTISNFSILLKHFSQVSASITFTCRWTTDSLMGQPGCGVQIGWVAYSTNRCYGWAGLVRLTEPWCTQMLMLLPTVIKASAVCILVSGDIFSYYCFRIFGRLIIKRKQMSCLFCGKGIQSHSTGLGNETRCCSRW